MARLSARDRAALPDRAFAYIDASGRRRLPIHDAAHVRNALARFDRVAFESDEAKDEARRRLLRAAKRHGIMPVGFIAAQLRPARVARALPTGTVTFLLTDVEGSTTLLRTIGDRYADLLRDLRALIGEAVTRHGGVRVDSYGDGFFAAFADAEPALLAAIDVQRGTAARRWPAGTVVRVRAGVHTGRPTLTDGGYVGLSVHAVARICAAAHGGQVLVSGGATTAMDRLPDGISLTSLGARRLPGLPRREHLFQVAADGLGTAFPPLRGLE